MEETLINTIRVNFLLPYDENKISLCLEQKQNLIPEGIYFNIFYKNINEYYEEFENNKDQYSNLEKMKEDSNKKENYFETFRKMLNKNYIKHKVKICTLKNLKLEKYIEENKTNEKSKFNDNDILILIKVKNDGNSIFRSFIKSYFIKLIRENKLIDFHKFLTHIRDSKIAYQIKKYNKEIDIVQKITLSISEIICESNVPAFSLAVFSCFCGFFPKFEISLIKIIRELIYKFCKNNPLYPLDNFESIHNEVPTLCLNKTYQDYIQNNIRKYGFEGIKIGHILKLFCLIFQVSIRIVDSKIKQHISRKEIFYCPNNNIFDSSKLLITNFKDKKIFILEKNEYYESAENCDSENSYKIIKSYESTFLMKIDYIKQYQLKLKCNKDQKLSKNENEFNENKKISPANINRTQYESNKQANSEHQVEENSDPKKLTNDSQNKKEKISLMHKEISSASKKPIKNNNVDNTNKSIQPANKKTICTCEIEEHQKELFFNENIIFNSSIQFAKITSTLKLICYKCSNGILLDDFATYFSMQRSLVINLIVECRKIEMNHVCMICRKAFIKKDQLEYICPKHYVHENCLKKNVLPQSYFECICMACSISFNQIISNLLNPELNKNAHKIKYDYSNIDYTMKKKNKVKISTKINHY